MANSAVFSIVSRLTTRTLLPQSCARIANKRGLCAAASVKQNQASEPTSSQAPTEATSAESPPPQPDLTELTKQIDELKQDFADMKDKYQRSLADRENVRRRLEKQVADAKLYGIQGFCKDLLEVSDVFRKALESVAPDQLEGTGNEELRSLYDGLSMTETQMMAVFRRNGLSTITLKVGDKFDPSWQEAMFEVAATENSGPPGTVAHVMRQGWNLHDRCIRSAQVGVVKE